jgi:predicted deacetylase
MNLDTPRYLIRFDDLCPTMLSGPLEKYLSIVARYGVRPILAVVPDNQDPALKQQPPDPGFWDRMRSLENHGATIAMHGYRHLCSSQGKSLLGLHAETEFAGVEESQQRVWIRCGLSILRDQGLCPRLFVAPRHGFDRSTLRALAREGLGILSDGFARRPFTRHDVIWIPQQLWEPVKKPSGFWTICIHTNTAPESLAEKLERFLDQNARNFTCFDEVISDRQPGALFFSERMGEKIANLRVRYSGGTRRQALVA